MNIDFSKLPVPSFLYIEKKIIENCEKIKIVEKETNVKFLVAFKAFSQWKLFPIIKKYFNAAAVSSPYEALLSYNYFSKKNIHLYSVAIDEKEVLLYSKICSHIVFNSLNQFFKFKNHFLKNNIKLGIRVNPQYSEVKTDLYNPSSPFSRLGVCDHHLKNGLPKEISGLHFHVLCENDSYALENTLKEFIKRFGHLLNDIEWVNFGGGHLITHKNYNIDHLIKVINDFKHKYRHLEIYMEPGAAYVWEAAYLVAKVLDIVENNGVKTAIVNVSFAAHMPDTLEMPYKPNIVGALPYPKENFFIYRIGGISCLAGDFMTEYSFEKPLNIDDIILFEDMAHYTVVKTNMFNGLNHPAIVLLTTNNDIKVLKEFSFEDYKNRID